MNRYQIVEIAGKGNDAGTKATQDVVSIASRLGFNRIPIRMTTTSSSKIAKIQRQLGYWADWNQAYKTIESNSIILLQNPFHYPQLTREHILRKLKSEKHVKYISVIHDVEELRKFRYNDYYKHEYDTMVELSDCFIVHNQKMAEFFCKRGIPDEKIIVLGIFDYLQEGSLTNSPEFARQITVAGNLDVKKCAYIGQLRNLNDLEIQLYGPNFDSSMKEYSNIHYGGSLPPDEVPQKLTKGFGLIWDGTSIDGCKGDAGQYLRYNNPHKLSLYLSSGLPVIIWSGAAESDFVKANDVGLTVDSLYDLSSKFKELTKEQYIRYAYHARCIADRLRKGAYMQEALTKALQIVER